MVAVVAGGHAGAVEVNAARGAPGFASGLAPTSKRTRSSGSASYAASCDPKSPDGSKRSGGTLVGRPYTWLIKMSARTRWAGVIVGTRRAT